MTGYRIGSYIIELSRIGTHVFLWHETDFDEALAVLVGFRPRIGIRVVTASAVGQEELFALCSLLAVDLSEYIFGPFGRSQTIQ